MKFYDAYALTQTAPLAVICTLAGRAVMPFTPWAGWTMLGLGALCALLTIEILAGWPLITAYADRRWRRRRLREGLGG